jgi:diguanylate cyclase (GGDEF)-like protein
VAPGSEEPHRPALTAERSAAHLARTQNTATRLETAALRDEHADRRDAEADRRDSIAESDDQEAESISVNGGGSDEQRKALYAADAVRKRAAAARKRAAADRHQAAEDRKRAAEDRQAADAELELAYVDHLTGAYRRGAGEAALNNEMIRAKRADGPLIIAFIDVNGLKTINDRHGHGAGDALLHEVAVAIRLRLRPYDPIVRVGGDEFVCAVSGVEMGAARARFDEIRAAIAGGSISVGLAAMEPEDTLEALIERSDAELRSGRRES